MNRAEGIALCDLIEHTPEASGGSQLEMTNGRLLL